MENGWTKMYRHEQQGRVHVRRRYALRTKAGLSHILGEGWSLALGQDEPAGRGSIARTEASGARLGLTSSLLPCGSPTWL